MRRDVLFNAAKRVKDDLEASSINQMFESGLELSRKRGESPKDSGPSWISFEVFQRYSILTSTYDAAERSILEILGLMDLMSPVLWTKMSEFGPAQVYRYHQRIGFAIEYLPKLLKLIEQDLVQAVRNPSPGTPRELSAMSLMTVLMVEDDGQFSSPARLVHVLESVASMYSVIATIEGQTESDLAVLACDSGSDKSFDFLGLAKLMEEVRKIIVSIWDRRVFYRHMHVSQCMGIIADSLPIIEKIHALKETGALGPEQAELLKRRTIDGATKFLEAGAIIAEMDTASTHSPRMLMRPEPKLLTAPSPTPRDATEGDHDSDDNPSNQTQDMTSDEVAELERLVEKAKKLNTPKSRRKKDASQETPPK